MCIEMQPPGFSGGCISMKLQRKRIVLRAIVIELVLCYNLQRCKIQVALCLCFLKNTQEVTGWDAV